jgi:hypothetical protein
MLGNLSATALLKLLFQNIPFDDIGDSDGLQPSAAAGQFYVALHSADPGPNGSQATNEVAYTGYARVGVVRSAAGFSVVGNVVTNAAPIVFPPCTGGSSVGLWFSFGTLGTGAGTVLVRGQLDPAIPISDGTTPAFEAGELGSEWQVEDEAA